MRILVADDHGIVRAGIRLLLERQPDLDVVAEAADGVEAVEQALASRPDLCILDVGMPRMTGLQAAREIRSHLPDARVLMLSMHDDERYLFEALKAGASGYVLKREADQDLVGAVRAVGRGEAFLTNAAERSIIRRWMDDGAEGPGDPADPARGRGRQADRRGPHQLADRRDPPPLGEDGRVAPRERPAQARDARPGRARALRDPPRPRRAVDDTGRSAPTHRRPCVRRVDHIEAPRVPRRQLPWVNVAMLRMDQQLGRPVLIEFWDFCRANSIRTLPYMKAWHERYATAGLRVIGVHTSRLRAVGRTPKRSRRRSRGWRSPTRSSSTSSTRSGSCTGTSAGRPATSSTRQGTLFDYHYGEGGYDETERAIQELLGIEQPTLAPLRPEDVPGALLSRRARTWTGAYSGPYQAGGVWAVLDGSGSVAATAATLDVDHPGCYELISHERSTAGELELTVGDGRPLLRGLLHARAGSRDRVEQVDRARAARRSSSARAEPGPVRALGRIGPRGSRARGPSSRVLISRAPEARATRRARRRAAARRDGCGRRSPARRRRRAARTTSPNARSAGARGARARRGRRAADRARRG